MSDTTIAAKLPLIDLVTTTATNTTQLNANRSWKRFKKMSQLPTLQGLFILGVNLFVVVLLCVLLIPRLL